MCMKNMQDVLLGRGCTIDAHPGNALLRNMVKEQKVAFQECNRKEKRVLATKIVNDMQHLDPPGRFLVENPTATSKRANNSIASKTWVIVDHDKAVEKVLHRFRDKGKKKKK